MKKRIFSLGILLILMCFILTGCGNKSEETSTNESNKNTQNNSTSIDTEIKTNNNTTTQDKTSVELGFYADKMCLTERYLGTVIRQTSGTTAKGWIDRAIITRVKVELRHTSKSVAQISEEMNFPNPSFFSKYFRRLTGMTPMDYKLST